MGSVISASASTPAAPAHSTMSLPGESSETCFQPASAQQVSASRSRATYTTDGDLAIDPNLLSDDPDIWQVLVNAGYQRGPYSGAFLAPNGVEIDLMVPEGAVPISSRRSVELAGQSRFTARAAGLELTLLDADPLQVADALRDLSRRLLATYDLGQWRHTRRSGDGRRGHPRALLLSGSHDSRDTKTHF